MSAIAEDTVGVLYCVITCHHTLFVVHQKTYKLIETMYTTIRSYY